MHALAGSRRRWILVLVPAALAGSAPAQDKAQSDNGAGPWRSVEVAAGTLRAETVATGLHYPWSLVFLPDGGMLVSEKHPGRLRRIASDGTVSKPLDGLPPIYSRGNGGLLGLALDPDFAENRRIFFAYSEPGEGEKAGLSVGRATLGEASVTDVETIFRQTPKVNDVRNSASASPSARTARCS